MKQFKFLMAVAITAITVLATNPAAAKNTKQASKRANATNTIDVKQYSSDHQYVYLQVQLQQSMNQPATLRISDELGELLFVDKFSTKQYNRLVKINPEELGKIDFTLTTADGSVSKKFKVALKTFSTVTLEELSNK